MILDSKLRVSLSFGAGVNDLNSNGVVVTLAMELQVAYDAMMGTNSGLPIARREGSQLEITQSDDRGNEVSLHRGGGVRNGSEPNFGKSGHCLLHFASIIM